MEDTMLGVKKSFEEESSVSEGDFCTVKEKIGDEDTHRTRENLRMEKKKGCGNSL